MSHPGRPHGEQHTDQHHRDTATSSPQLPHAYDPSANAQPSAAFSNYYPSSSMTYGPLPLHYPHSFPTNWDYSLTSSGYHLRSSYLQQPPPVLPEVTNYNPRRGAIGSKLYIYLRSYVDLAAQPPITYIVMFHNRACHGSLYSIGRKDQYYEYALAAYVPEPEHVSAFSAPIPLHLDMQDTMGQSFSFFGLGDFSYMSFSQLQDLEHGFEASKKRKWDHDPEYTSSSSPSLTGRSYQYWAPTAPSTIQRGGDYADIAATPSYETPTFSTSQSYGIAQRVLEARATLPSSASAPSSLGFGISERGTSPRGRSQDPTSPVRKRSKGPWRQSRAPMARTASLPAGTAKLPKTSHARDPSPADSLDRGNPRLVRTSTMAHPPGTVAGAQATQEFNPYSIYPTKVTLEFDGELDDMLKDWTEDELSAKRRLVQFERTQTDNILSVSFKAVGPKDRASASICVSCIWWEEKQEAFVTSVDTINLLQSLIGARFTVEEKNRTRRNLEGFKPLTVAKSKEDSADFFRTIMGFSNPRPRNIEKDVKVFPWTILPLALKKVIAKYSPDYASTAGILAPPGPSDENAQRDLDEEWAEAQSPTPSPSATSGMLSKTPSRQNNPQPQGQQAEPAPPPSLYMPQANLPSRLRQMHREPHDFQLEQQPTPWDFGAYGPSDLVQSDLVATPSVSVEYEHAESSLADPSDLSRRQRRL